jgi:uncharacterized repeat protein (TIGR01451 family)
MTFPSQGRFRSRQAFMSSLLKGSGLFPGPFLTIRATEPRSQAGQRGLRHPGWLFLAILSLLWFAVALQPGPNPISPDTAGAVLPADTTTLAEVSTTTDDLGTYIFADLQRATHPVWVDLESLSEQVGTTFANEIRLNVNPGQHLSISVDGIGLSASYNEAGSEIRGLVWHDTNNDAVRDPTERAIPDVQVIDPGIHVYYVPFQQNFLANQFYEQIDSAGCIPGQNRIDPTQGTRTIISITTGANPATWFYDHHEDGYETDLTNPVQASTLSSTIGPGGTQVFTTVGAGTAAPTNTPPSSLPYDGRDRVVILGDPVNFVRIAMAEGVSLANGTSLSPAVTAMASDVGEVAEWGRNFDFVWGTDLAASDGNFRIVVPFIMASEDNTTVIVDPDGPGGAAALPPFTLNQGEVIDPALIGNISSTGTVSADKLIQVTMTAINCTEPDAFGLRAMNLEPTGQWTNDYYSPIPSFANACTFEPREVLTGYQLHNPGSTPIDVIVEGNDNTTIRVQPETTVLFTATPNIRANQRGLHFFTTDPNDVFYVSAVVDIGAGATSGGDFDWGFSLIPAGELTSQTVIGWSNGDLNNPPNALFSLAWLTPVTDTVIFVDLNSDGIPDNFDSNGDGAIDANTNLGVPVAALDLLRIADPTDFSLQGATIYTENLNQPFALAFGQDPCLAPRSGTALDLGYTVRPIPAISLSKSAELADDADGDGQISPGDTIGWIVTLQNIGRGIADQVVLTDTFDFLDDSSPGVCTVEATGMGRGDCADWVTGSLTTTLPTTRTFYGETQNPADLILPADSPATEGYRLVWDFISPSQTVTVTFQTKLADTLPISLTRLANHALVSASNVGPIRSPDAEVPIGQPILEIRKFHLVDDVAETVGPNEVFSYTVVLTNTGNITAVNTLITDTLPAELTYQPGSLQVSLAGAAFTSVPDPVQIVTPTLVLTDSLMLGAGQTVTYTLDVQLTASPATDILTNVVEANASNLHLPPPRATEPVAVLGVDLQIDKDDGGVIATPGGIITYTLTFSNIGPSEATGVVITETVPTYTSFSAAASQPTLWSCPDGSPAATICLHTIQTMTVGSRFTITFAVVVTNALPAGVDTITNTVLIGDDGSHGPDPTPGNNIDREPTPLLATPDLAISKVDGGEIAISPGQLITYTISYTNTGNQEATGVIITETVPANTTFVGPASWSCASGSPAGTVCNLNLPSLAVGATGTISFVVQVASIPPAGGFIINTVSINDDGSNGPDPTPNDNTDTIDTPRGSAPDMSIAKTDGGITTAPGGVVTYTMTYTNLGTITATGVVITETVPDNTTYNAAASAPFAWACVPDGSAGSICTLTVGDVAGNGTGSAIFAITVDDPLPTGVDTITNTAIIADDGRFGPDPTPENNSSTDTTPIPIAAALEMNKSVNVQQVAPNQAVTYTIVITNTSGVIFNPVLLTDTLPAGVTYIQGTANPPLTTVNGQVLSWADVTGGAGLLPNQNIQITYQVAVTTTPGDYTNVAMTEGQSPGGTVTAQDDTTISVPTPAVIMRKGVVPPGVVNSILTYTVQITNVGLSVLDQVPLSDFFTQDAINYLGGTPPADNVDNANGVVSWNDLTIPFGRNLNPGETFVVETVFQVVATTDTFTATNRARVSGAEDEFGNQVNDHEVDIVLTNIPTAVDLLYFQASQQGDYILLSWATAIEYDNFGFHLLRSETNNRDEAVEIAFIPGQGHGVHSGTTYTFRDDTVEANQVYHYWLVDVDLNGDETIHGPSIVTVLGGVDGGGFDIFLPLILK